MWLYIENPIPEFTDTDIVFYIAFIPLFVAIGMELKDYWDSPEPQEEGSPVGNKIAVILGFIVFVLVIFGIVMTVINNA